MRVLLINDYQTLGGVEVVVERTAELLRDDQHEVRVFTGQECVGRQSPLGYISSGRAKRALRKVLEEFSPDVVHIHNLYHLLSPAILGVCAEYQSSCGLGIVMTVHDHHLVCPNPGRCFWKSGVRYHAQLPVDRGLVSLLGRRWDHRSIGRSLLRVLQWWWNYSLKERHLVPDVIVSPSTRLAEHVREIGHPDVRVVHNPLPKRLDVVQPSNDERLRVAVVGRIEPEKGVAGLIEHWPGLVPTKMAIVGDGSDISRCRSVYESRDGVDDALEVEFLGWREHSETMQLIAGVDILAVPSIGPEVAPLVLDEAMAVGTKVLVADQPALRLAVPDVSLGWVYDPSDAEELSRCVLQIEQQRIEGQIRIVSLPVNFQNRAPEVHLKMLLEAYGV